MNTQGEVSKELSHTLEQWATAAGIAVSQFLESFDGLSPDDERVLNMLLSTSLVDCFSKRIDAALTDTVASGQIKLKNDVRAKELRLKGNDYYSKKQFDEAHNFYTQATRFAVYGGNQLCLSYANRSAINYECERWNQAINDIDMAIKHGYPKDKMDKLLQRKFKCLDKLKVAQDIVPSSIIQDNSEVSKLIESIKLDLDDPEEVEESFIEKVNPTMPSASIKVSITNDPKRGRGLKTDEKINFGEIIIKDEPYAHSLFSDCYDDYCQNCCKVLDGFSVPCPVCPVVQYCSLDCQIADDVHVKFSCRPLVPHINDPLIQLMLRLLTKLVIKQADAQLQLVNESNSSDQIYNSDYTSFTKLSFAPTLSTDLVLPSLYISLLVQKIYPAINKPSLNSLASTVLIHFHRLLINKTFLIYNENSIDFSCSSPDETSEKIGLAIYPTMSLINHSCQPNAFLFFFHEKVIIRASQAIEPGQEIFICYGPSYQSHTLTDRRKKLRDWYYFDCECIACSQSLESPQICFKCPRCNGKLIVNEDGSNNCLSCKEKGLLKSDAKKSVDEAFEDMIKGRAAYESNKYDEAVQLLSKSYNTMDDHLYRSNRNLLRSRTFLYECLASMGHFEMAAKLCAVNVNVTREIHGSESVDYVVSMITYLGLMYRDLEDIVTENLIKADQKTKQIIHLVDEQLERLIRLSHVVNMSNDPSKVFQQEMRNLKAIKEQCQRIAEYIASNTEN